MEGTWLRKQFKEWEAEESKATQLRRESADQDYIKRTPAYVRQALEFYIETGDLLRAARKYTLSYPELNSYRIKANIPRVV